MRAKEINRNKKERFLQREALKQRWGRRAGRRLAGRAGRCPGQRAPPAARPAPDPPPPTVRAAPRVPPCRDDPEVLKEQLREVLAAEEQGKMNPTLRRAAGGGRALVCVRVWW